jgi:hypothetical protein
MGVAGAAAVSMAGVAMPHEVELPDPYPGLLPRETAIPAFNPQARFFDEHQYALTATIAALIVPADDSPGATEAGVVDAIDRMLAAAPEMQDTYKKGLRWIDTLSQERYGADSDFLKLKSSEQIDLLRIIDRSNLIHRRQGSTFWEKVDIKLGIIWDELFGLGRAARFFRQIHRDTITAFYSSEVSWKAIGFYGPPQPEGYPDFMDPPSVDHYSGAERAIRPATCKTCHQDVKHPVGELIDHSCNRCHRPHEPWPVDDAAFHLEDRVGFVFPTPDRRLEDK